MTKEIKIIISGGGTGGHVFPAIAIANALKNKNSSIRFLFVGAKGKIEMEKVPAAGYEIVGLNIKGFQRKISLRNLANMFRLFVSMFKSTMVVNRFGPDVAVGVGGYASGPILKVAGWKRIPTVIQEQNSYPGVTNRMLASGASRICTAYEGLEKYFPKGKISLTGNPVRASIVHMQCNPAESKAHFGLDKDRKTVLIIGGSLGARTLNEGVKSAIKDIAGSPHQVLWQTGKLYFEECREVAAGISNLSALQFIDRMDMAYTAADVIVARAGALTISELCLVGKPVILIPSPNVAEDHQTHNAMSLVSKNAAIMMKDEHAKDRLIRSAFELLSNEGERQKLQENIKRMAIPDAADRIADEILKLIK